MPHRPALEGAPRGGEGQVHGGNDAAPRQWPRGFSRLGSRLGTVPASSAHHYSRARASPCTATGHGRAAHQARRAIRRAHRATHRPTCRAARSTRSTTNPAALRVFPNLGRTNWPGHCARRTARPFLEVCRPGAAAGGSAGDAVGGHRDKLAPGCKGVSAPLSQRSSRPDCVRSRGRCGTTLK